MKNRILSSLLVIAMVLGVLAIMPITAAADGFYIGPTGGRFLAPIEPPAVGSIAISTRAELEVIRSNGVYHLTADIDLSGAEWEPLGLNNPFTGTFDGQGFIIRNLTSTDMHQPTGQSTAYAGLFARTSGNAVIKNVGLEGTRIQIGEIGTPVEWWGGFDSFAGGIVARIEDNSTVSNSYNTGSVSAVGFRAYAGGISGFAGRRVTISNSYNTGNITADANQSHAGGIVGSLGANSPDTTINNTFNTGNVSAVSSSNGITVFAGGIAGSIDNFAHRSAITNSHNTGNISSSISAGGISGRGGVINRCYNTGTISAIASPGMGQASHAGGIVGWRGTISNSFNMGAVSATSASVSHAGGIVGFEGITGNSYNAGSVSAISTGNNAAHAGGISGRNTNISNSFNMGDVSGQSESGATHVGAIAGSLARANTTTNCYWSIDSGQTVDGETRANARKVGVGSGVDNTVHLDAAQFRNRATFAAFDFDYVWTMNENINNGYPTLRPYQQPHSETPQIDGISVILNGVSIVFDVPPMIVNGRTMVPFRAIFEALGMGVEWDNDNRIAIGYSGNLRIEIPIDSYTAYVNGEAMMLDVPAMIYDGRTLVPVRFIAEATGANVEWCQETQTVIITN